ncbi:MAG: 50S ribosomal protein L35 [Chloroflexi bacterium]|nr:50S ribosomal protein L35 [Chloroflexota bacterium]
MAKYKLKTHSGAKKRLSLTGTGKLARAKALSSHLRRRKPARTRRLYHQKLPVHKVDTGRLRRLLPTGL